MHNKFIVNLMIGTYFLIMRSCEYSKTPEKPRSDIVTLDRVIFIYLSSNKKNID